MVKRVLLAVNSDARRGRDACARAAAALRAAGHGVTVISTHRDPDVFATTIAEHHGSVDVIAVGGGDGTLRSAITGIRAGKIPLLILPLGTINELARTLAIPFEIERACAVLDDGEPLAVDVGSVNDCWFFNEASIGLSTHVARAQTGEVKGRWGMLAVPIATLRSLGFMRPFHLDVETERGAQTFRTVQLTVANNHRFGGVVENTQARLNDGLLDLYSIDIRRWHDVFAILAAVALKRFPQTPCVTGVRADRFIVRSRHRHRVFADGEPATYTPATFALERHAIDVYVPKAARVPSQ